MDNKEELSSKALEIIGKAAKLPLVRVDRESFLGKQFSAKKYDLYREDILKYGPQKVLSMEEVLKKANEVVKNSTKKTAMVSFVAGLSANPALMVPLGGADVAQFFGFALNMAQQIAYLFGEEQLFDAENSELSDDTKIRIVTYLGVMLGVSGANSLISKTSVKVGTSLSTKVARTALMSQPWYVLLKKVAAVLGQKMTRQSLQKIITKSIPVIGGGISAGVTLVTFKPMGKKLIKAFLDDYKENLEPITLNSDYKHHKKQDDNNIIDGSFYES